MLEVLVPLIMFGAMALTVSSAIGFAKIQENRRYGPEKREMVRKSKEYWYEILGILVWLPQDKYRSLNISPETILKQSQLIKEAELRLKKRKWFDLLEITQPLNTNTLDIHKRIVGWQRYSEAWDRYHKLRD